MKQAVAYYRVSTPKQKKDGFSLEAQRIDVMAFAVIHGFEIVREYTEVESGRKVKKRKEIRRAIRLCDKIDATLLIATLDRLARNVAFTAALMDSKTKFIAIEKPNADRYELHKMAVEAEEESRRISRRTKITMAVAKKRGSVFGVSAKELAKQNKQEADKFAQAVYPIIEGLRIQGYSYQGVADELIKLGKKTFRGKRRWRVTTVYNICARVRQAAPAQIQIH